MQSVEPEGIFLFPPKICLDESSHQPTVGAAHLPDPQPLYSNFQRTESFPDIRCSGSLGEKKAGERKRALLLSVFLSGVGGEAFSSLCKEGLYVQEGSFPSLGLLRRKREPLVHLKRKENEIK